MLNVSDMQASSIHAVAFASGSICLGVPKSGLFAVFESHVVLIFVGGWCAAHDSEGCKPLKMQTCNVKASSSTAVITTLQVRALIMFRAGLHPVSIPTASNIYHT